MERKHVSILDWIFVTKWGSLEYYPVWFFNAAEMFSAMSTIKVFDFISKAFFGHLWSLENIPLSLEQALLLLLVPKFPFSRAAVLTT